eukprot:g18590.t1
MLCTRVGDSTCACAWPSRSGAVEYVTRDVITYDLGLPAIIVKGGPFCSYTDTKCHDVCRTHGGKRYAVVQNGIYMTQINRQAAWISSALLQWLARRVLGRPWSFQGLAAELSELVAVALSGLGLSFLPGEYDLKVLQGGTPALRCISTTFEEQTARIAAIFGKGLRMDFTFNSSLLGTGEDIRSLGCVRSGLVGMLLELVWYTSHEDTKAIADLLLKRMAEKVRQGQQLIAQRKQKKQKPGTLTAAADFVYLEYLARCPPLTADVPAWEKAARDIFGTLLPKTVFNSFRLFVGKDVITYPAFWSVAELVQEVDAID